MHHQIWPCRTNWDVTEAYACTWVAAPAIKASLVPTDFIRAKTPTFLKYQLPVSGSETERETKPCMQTMSVHKEILCCLLVWALQPIAAQGESLSYY